MGDVLTREELAEIHERCSPTPKATSTWMDTPSPGEPSQAIVIEAPDVDND